MDLKVFLPTFSVEQYESLSLLEFLEHLHASTNRQNAFFDEAVTGYVVLTNEDYLTPQEQEIYFSTLRRLFVSIDLSVHPSNGHRRPSKTNDGSHSQMGVYDNFQIKSFNYSYQDCIYSEAIPLSDESDAEEPSATDEGRELSTKSGEKQAVQFVSIWKFVLPISYPKRKINSPEIIISILLTLANYQKIIQNAKLFDTLSPAATSKIMLHENSSTDEITLQKVYRPAQEQNLLQGLVPQIKCDPILQTFDTPVLPVSKLSDHSSSSESLDQTSDPGILSHMATSVSGSAANGNKRSSIISTYSNANNDDTVSPIINLNAKILLPVYPVLNMRLKCTKPAGRNDILLTTLEIESSKELNKIGMSLNLLEIDLEFPNGSIKPLIPSILQNFPIEINYNDNLNFIYELINNNSSENLTKKPIMITLISQPVPKSSTKGNLLPDFSANSNRITTRWNTLVDFSIVAPPTSTALKSQYGKSVNSSSISSSNNSTGNLSQGKQHVWQRGASGSSNSIISSLSTSSPQPNKFEPPQQQLSSRVTSPLLNSTSFSMGVYRESASNSLDQDSESLHQKLKNQTRTTSASLTVNIPRTSKLSVLNGLILSFHGTTNVKVGQIFKWKIQAINKSHKILNLSLYIQPKDNNNHSFLTANLGGNTNSNFSSSSHNTITAGGSTSLNKSFNGSHNKIHKNQIIYPYVTHADSPNSINLTKVFNQTKLTPTGIICLNNDVRIGPFDHYSVFETEINLIAIEKGIFSLQGVKIIDITSGESFDCGKLLEVVVFD